MLIVGVLIRCVQRYDLVKIKPKDSANDSVAYDLVKTRLSESEAEAQEKTIHNARFRVSRFTGSSASASDSDNLVSLDHKRRSPMQNRKRLKRSYSFDSDFFERTTPFFDFH